MFFNNKPPLPKHWQDADYAVLDFECTGMDSKKHEVVQIGVVVISGGRIQLSESWATWVKPSKAWSEDTVRVHGLSPELLAHAPLPSDIVAPLQSLLQHKILVAHYAPLEVGFLKQWNIKTPHVLDTLALSLRLQHATVSTAKRDEYTLNALAQRYHVPIHGEHDALADALITAQVFMDMAHQLTARGFTLKDMLALH